MGTRVLSSLAIEGFRAFEHLTIERLGQVNLVVGKNNVGKSCLLEALQIYAHRGAPRIIRQILTSRDEEGGAYGRTAEVEAYIQAIKYLFYGRKAFADRADFAFTIGPVDDANLRLAVTTRWIEESPNNVSPGITIAFGQEPATWATLSRLFDNYALIQRAEGTDCIFVPANSLDAYTLIELWDNVALKPGEQDVLKGMHIIAPEVERLNLIGTGGQEHRFTRIPVVKVRDEPEPIPLRSLGEGMTRLFGLVLALVNARDGILLVDEVDSGLHYTVYPALWRLIFQVAADLNVQVFATTHSWDCIEGFQQAAQQVDDEAGMLIRLERRQGHIVPILFDTSRLSIATRQEIEVR
jgi:predicted ATPase